MRGRGSGGGGLADRRMHLMHLSVFVCFVLLLSFIHLDVLVSVAAVPAGRPCSHGLDKTRVTHRPGRNLAL